MSKNYTEIVSGPLCMLRIAHKNLLSGPANNHMDNTEVISHSGNRILIIRNKPVISGASIQLMGGQSEINSHQ